VGYQNTLFTKSTKFGLGAVLLGGASTAIGQDSQASANSVTVGKDSISGNGAVAMGVSTSATGTRSVSVGCNSQGTNTDSTALGDTARAAVVDSVALGADALAGFVGTGAHALGARSIASAAGALAAGYLATASGVDSVAAGKDSLVAGAQAVGVGPNTVASTISALAIGDAAVVSADYGLAIGCRVAITHAGAIAIGCEAVSTAANRMTVGTIGGSYDMELQIGRKLGVGVAPGSAMIHAQADAAATIGAIVQGAASQSANLQEWQSSTGAAVAAIKPGGDLSLSSPAQRIGANVGTGSFVGMRLPSIGVVELHTTNTMRVSVDEIRIFFSMPLSWNTLGTFAGSHFEGIKNIGASAIPVGAVVVMSGASREVEQSSSANQQGVLVATQSANPSFNTRVADRGMFKVLVEALEVVAPGDKLVSSVTAGTAKVDNAETDPSKIVGYAWESKTIGGTRETVLFRVT
ncbi:hypothetical protein LCGC14_1273240, partial [marine sediment metagenome]